MVETALYNDNYVNVMAADALAPWPWLLNLVIKYYHIDLFCNWQQIETYGKLWLQWFLLPNNENVNSQLYMHITLLYGNYISRLGFRSFQTWSVPNVYLMCTMLQHSFLKVICGCGDLLKLANLTINCHLPKPHVFGTIGGELIATIAQKSSVAIQVNVMPSNCLMTWGA